MGVMVYTEVNNTQWKKPKKIHILTILKQPQNLSFNSKCYSKACSKQRKTAEPQIATIINKTK